MVLTLGNTPRVSSLMAGISNLRPPSPNPKYCTILDVQTVLNHLWGLPDYTLLSPKQLTLNRVCELKLSDMSYMTLCKSNYVFLIFDLI